MILLLQQEAYCKYQRVMINQILWLCAKLRAAWLAEMLNNCERVRIEVNPKTRCILLIPVTSKDKDAVRWAKTGKEVQPRKIECLAFTSQLFDGWGWDRKRVYRTTGRIVSSDKKIMLLFDFSNPESWPMKEKATGK